MKEVYMGSMNWHPPDPKKTGRRVLYLSSFFLVPAVFSYLLKHHLSVDGTSSFLMGLPIIFILLVLGIYDISGNYPAKKRKGIGWSVLENILFGILLGINLSLEVLLLFAVVVLVASLFMFALSRNQRILELKPPHGFSVSLHFKLMDAIERQLIKEGVHYSRHRNSFRLSEGGKSKVTIEVGDEDVYYGFSNDIVIKGAKREVLNRYENIVNAAVIKLPPLSSFTTRESFFCPSCGSPVSFDILSGTFYCKKCRESIRYSDVIRRETTGNL